MEKLQDKILDIALLLGAITIILYILFSSGVVLPDLANPLSNVLFAILNMIVTIYTSFRISYFSFLRQNEENQKKVAKTSIRHIRNYLVQVHNLISIIEEKSSIVSDDLFKQHLLEIENHLKNIANGIKSSENDFKDIVNEEYKEENEIIAMIMNNLSELQEKQKELKEIQDAHEQSTLNKVNDIQKDIREVRVDLNKNISNLPFGYTGSITSSNNENLDSYVYNYIINMDKYKIFDKYWSENTNLTNKKKQD